MRALRVVLAALAGVMVLGLSGFMLWIFPRFMQVFRDIEVKDFSATATSGMIFSNFLYGRAYIAIPLLVILVGGLIVLAAHKRVTNRVSITISSIVLELALIAAPLFISGVFTTMTGLIKSLMSQG